MYSSDSVCRCLSVCVQNISKTIRTDFDDFLERWRVAYLMAIRILSCIVDHFPRFFTTNRLQCISANYEQILKNFRRGEERLKNQSIRFGGNPITRSPSLLRFPFSVMHFQWDFQCVSLCFARWQHYNAKKKNSPRR